jgi:hypothetical protein
MAFFKNWKIEQEDMPSYGKKKGWLAFPPNYDHVSKILRARTYEEIREAIRVADKHYKEKNLENTVAHLSRPIEDTWLGEKYNGPFYGKHKNK